MPAVVTRRGGDLDELRERLRGQASVLVGHSGVGKSTLINALVPSADRAIGRVSAIGKGRHTSSSAIALALPDGDGWVIDTPGVRSFGLAHVSADDLLWAFPDLEDGAAQCPPGLRAPVRRRRAARWTPGWRTAMPRRSAWTRSAGCSRPAIPRSCPRGAPRPAAWREDNSGAEGTNRP